MSLPRRLTLLVEGDGDKDALPGLVTRLLRRNDGSDALYVDDPLIVGDIRRVLSQRKKTPMKFLDFLGVAAKRENLAAILIVLDSDVIEDGRTTAVVEKYSWEISDARCPAHFAYFLAERSREAGAGAKFSLGVVFARQEFESWLLAGLDGAALGLKPKAEGLPGANAVENAPRDAKGWLSHNRLGGYDPVSHQKELTSRLDIENLLDPQRGVRSFRRLDHAVEELIVAVRTGSPIVSPSGEPSHEAPTI